jgi:hypothetical protein
MIDLQLGYKGCGEVENFVGKIYTSPHLGNLNSFGHARMNQNKRIKSNTRGGTSEYH